ncbi:MAG: tripartite tricarboxylate transporter TctB family protein [Azospirillaceae bacterium]
MMKRNYKDVAGGGLFVALGLYVFVSAFGFGIGTTSRMGAGYYPMVLGVVAIVLGAVIVALGWQETAERPRVAVKPLLAVLAGLIAFYVLVDRAGMIPAIWGLTGLASLADNDITWRGTIGLMLAVSLAAWLLFSVFLGLPIAGVEGLF